MRHPKKKQQRNEKMRGKESFVTTKHLKDCKDRFEPLEDKPWLSQKAPFPRSRRKKLRRRNSTYWWCLLLLKTKFYYYHHCEYIVYSNHTTTIFLWKQSFCALEKKEEKEEGRTSTKRRGIFCLWFAAPLLLNYLIHYSLTWHHPYLRLETELCWPRHLYCCYYC